VSGWQFAEQAVVVCAFFTGHLCFCGHPEQPDKKAIAKQMNVKSFKDFIIFFSFFK